MTTLDGLEDKTIRFLRAGDNSRLSDIDAVSHIKGMKWLDLSRTAITQTFELRGLELEQLDLSNNRNLTSLTGLDNMTTLRKLDLTNCNSNLSRYADYLESTIRGLKITR